MRKVNYVMQKKNALVNRGVWLDKRFVEMSVTARLSYMYLLSAPSGDSSGFFRFPVKFISGDIGVDESDVLDALSELVEYKFVEYDEDVELLFVPAIVENTLLKTKKHIKGFLSDLDKLPNSPLLTSLKIMLDGLYPKMRPTYNDLFVGRVDEDLVEKKKATEKESKKKAREEDRETAKKEKEAIDAAFEQFYSIYPRKAQKGYAREAFGKVLDKNKHVTKEDLIVASKKFKEHCIKNHTEMQYIPYPSSFLGRSQEYKDYLPKEGETVLIEEPVQEYDPSQPVSMDNLPSNEQLIDMFLQE